ncbi:ATP-binding cassette domain-containing protein [Rubellimicrobium rubrum]|uniref:ATP-binding cassette domain-containing protein n=1 Tax=Rubellimicrobium rubrum TaxID=2585369 RepID=A0A5C4MV99_9RHOB|nr:ATP-binding cassette domain-containing protein [Rubellimicrobium rubrum]TNC49904.1 ATP-binding cassette domain-containing protein [Rubellimicrobium rubrum]
MSVSDPLPLRVEDLVIRARDGRSVLELPHLDLPAGGTLAITGPSGAGKSSLLHALAGLLRPSKGRILWGTTDIACLSEAACACFRREKVGLVFQDFLLFEELGALGNAAVSATFAPARERPAIETRAQGWLARSGLGQRPEPNVRTFSGGERQRVAVARAMSHAPAVILADEPTASLDRASADRLIDDLVDVAAAEGRMLIAVTHDARLAERLGRELKLVDGRVVEQRHG